MSFVKPTSTIWNWPKAEPIPSPPYPLNINSTTVAIYEFFLNSKTPITIALVYFTAVHLVNNYIQKRQIKNALANNIKFDTNDPKSMKKLPPVPLAFAKTLLFKQFILLHNIFLCVYSVWSFYSMLNVINFSTNNLYSILTDYYNKINNDTSQEAKPNLFWNAICDLDHGIWNINSKGLNYYAFWFYLSKYYEIFDTVIILLKGRPSSLLQSYHHSGAMLSMWAGVRYASPPIWIFVVFNSFIHSIMYFYYTLSILKIRIPKLLKACLTSLQICQFVFGGSLAFLHLFVTYRDSSDDFKNFKFCISSGGQAMALWINIFYLFPLTLLFGAFWIESYLHRKSNQIK